MGNGEELLAITYAFDITSVYILRLKPQSTIESVKAGIGDLTGNSLESCVLMIMVQSVVCTLLANNKIESVNSSI